MNIQQWAIYAGNRIQTMEAMDEIFSYLDEDMKLLIFTTIQKLYYLSDEDMRNCRKRQKFIKQIWRWMENEQKSVCSLPVKKKAGIEKSSFRTYEELAQEQIPVQVANYEQVYLGTMNREKHPEQIKKELEKKQPHNYKGHAVSTSDVLILMIMVSRPLTM